MIHRIYLSSNNKTSGDETNSNFLIQYPLKIKRGRMWVESLNIETSLINFNTAFRMLHIASQNGVNGYDISKISNNIISSIPINNNTYDGTNHYIVWCPSSKQSGLYFNSLNFDGQMINIKILDEDRDVLSDAHIATWNLMLIIEEFED